MSDIIEGADEQLDESLNESLNEANDAELAGDEVGLTSDEVGEGKKSLLKSMTIYDAMLLVSLICVGLATLFLFLELRTFGSSPWSTSGF